MKVYLMYRGEYEGRRVEGVFATRELAEAAWREACDAAVAHWNRRGEPKLAAAELREHLDVEEHEVVE